MTEFMRSYTEAMRSNIACTCGSESVPLHGAPGVPLMARLLQRAEEVDELVELLRVLLLEPRERRHRSGRVDQRARDGGLGQVARDVRQVRPRARVAVLADAVAALAAGRREHGRALLVLRRHGYRGQLAGCPRERALDREERHRGDRG